MNIETEVMGNQGENIPYEQPSLKKYGTMKEFTLGSGGSGGDAMGPRDPNNATDFGNPKLPPLPGIGVGEVLENDSDRGDDFIFGD